MGKYLLKLPKMGESIAEATITKWLKEVGDIVEVDESIVEIATDKVDSDVPSEFKGKLIKKNFEVNDIVKVGDTIAEIETDSIDNDDEVIDNSPKKQEDILIAQTLLVFSSHSDNELVSKMCQFRVNKVDRKDCKILN